MYFDLRDPENSANSVNHLFEYEKSDLKLLIKIRNNFLTTHFKIQHHSLFNMQVFTYLIPYTI